jgi:RNA polymerase sigma-70 factor (ECF subfamily)
MTAQELNTEFVEVKDAAYRYACSLLHNREEAEDLVQDLYEKLWRRRLLVRHKGFVQLVMTSARNMCMDILRARQKGRENTPQNYGGDVKRNAEDVRAGEWEEEKEKEDTAAIVEKLVERLPQKEREAFHLRVVEGLDYPVIAEIMGIAESAARMACSRGRNKVKEELLKIMDYGLERKQS